MEKDWEIFNVVPERSDGLVMIFNFQSSMSLSTTVVWEIGRLGERKGGGMEKDWGIFNVEFSIFNLQWACLRQLYGRLSVGESACPAAPKIVY